jgi:hypothetical protein
MEEAYEIANLKTPMTPKPRPKRPRSIACFAETSTTEVRPHTVACMKLALFLIVMHLRLAEEAGEADLLIELLDLRFVQSLRRTNRYLASYGKVHVFFFKTLYGFHLFILQFPFWQRRWKFYRSKTTPTRSPSRARGGAAIRVSLKPVT